MRTPELLILIIRFPTPPEASALIGVPRWVGDRERGAGSSDSVLNTWEVGTCWGCSKNKREETHAPKLKSLEPQLWPRTWPVTGLHLHTGPQGQLDPSHTSWLSLLLCAAGGRGWGVAGAHANTITGRSWIASLQSSSEGDTVVLKLSPTIGGQ